MMDHCVCDVNICSGDEGARDDQRPKAKGGGDRGLRGEGGHGQGRAEVVDSSDTDSLVIMAKEVTATYRIG